MVENVQHCALGHFVLIPNFAGAIDKDACGSCSVTGSRFAHMSETTGLKVG